MPEEMLNTKEVAEYLGINEKQVYALIKANRIPCTRVTGKWVFPKKLIDEWIDSTARGSISFPTQAQRSPGRLLAAGSNDPVLDLLISQNNKYDDFFIFSCNTGSTEGLTLMGGQQSDIAFCHLYDAESDTYNIPYITSHLKDKKIAVVHLFYREIGFLLSLDASKKVKNFSDLIGSNAQFVNRQKGSGIRLFLDHHLKKNNIESSEISGYETEVCTHFEIGLSILSGKAGVGISSVAISKLLGLPFVPLARESFDMVIGKDTFFEKGIQAFIDTLQSTQFKKTVEPLGDYDFNNSGKIIYSTTG